MSFCAPPTRLRARVGFADDIGGYRQAVTAVPDAPEARGSTRSRVLGGWAPDRSCQPTADGRALGSPAADPLIYLGGVPPHAGRRDEAAAQWRRYLRVAPTARLLQSPAAASDTTQTRKLVLLHVATTVVVIEPRRKPWKR